VESGHRGLRRRVAALALEVVASKVWGTGPSEWVRGAIWPHLVFFSLDSRDKSIFEYFSENLGLFRFVSVCYETVLFVSVVSI
jgi:hypothetical protein